MFTLEQIQSNPEHQQIYSKLKELNPGVSDSELLKGFDYLNQQGAIPETYTNAQSQGNMSYESGTAKTYGAGYAGYKGYKALDNSLKSSYGLDKGPKGPGLVSDIKNTFSDIRGLKPKKVTNILNNALKGKDGVSDVILKKGDDVLNKVIKGGNSLLKDARATGTPEKLMENGVNLLKKNFPGMSDDVARVAFKQLLKEGTPGIARVLSRVAGAGLKAGGKILGPAGFLIGAAFDAYDTFQETKEGKLKKGKGFVRFLDKTLLGALPNKWSMKSDSELAADKINKDKTNEPLNK